MTHTQKKEDEMTKDEEATVAKEEGTAGYVVTVWRPTLYGQWTYFTKNPEGGGFGMNTSSASLSLAIRQAVLNIPTGTAYQLIVNDQDRGVFITPRKRVRA